MQIMALIVQKKTGKTFLQLFEEYIKRPLGLTVSTYNGDNPRPACMFLLDNVQMDPEFEN